MPFNPETAKLYGAMGGREKGSKLSAKTKYEMLQARIVLTEAAIRGAPSYELKLMWISNLAKLREKADFMTIEEAESCQ
jgi:hypothetical protein